MILWKSVLEHREDSVPYVTRCILADRDVLKLEGLSLSFGHEYYSLGNSKWCGTWERWNVGVDFRRFKFGYWSSYYEVDHHVVSFGPFYVYWST